MLKKKIRERGKKTTSGPKKTGGRFEKKTVNQGKKEEKD